MIMQLRGEAAMIKSQRIGRCTKAQAVAFVTALTFAFAFASAASAAPVSDIQGYPILEALQAKGQTLAPDTTDWMKKWKGMNLDDSANYQFKELSGSTSINMKIEKIDTSDPKGYKSRGSYIPHNSAANPDVEIGASQLGALLGFDSIYRPAAPYVLGPVGSKALKSLIDNAHISNRQRLENKANILKAIQTGAPLKGCVKAKKDDTNVALDEIANTHAAPNGAPNSSHPIIRLLQASSPQPVQGKTVTLKNGYVGDELELAREFSMIMLIDAVTQQWDRYSGGNVVIRKDDQGHAHFYATDNGGADIASSWSPRNLNWFSRFDRSAVQKLTDIKKFLDAPATGYLGYTDPKVFVVDLGFYSLMGADVYAQRLTRNIGFVLDYVKATETKFGNAAYFP
jgi:hypothetical protein